MMKDDLGQASLDFLAGIIIFMGSLAMVIQFIPGIFTPYQTEATDLNSVAYRTGVLLVEDPGWWSNSSTNRSDIDWENHLNETNSALRVGLSSVDAVNKTIPNVLNKGKLMNFSKMNKNNLTESLGLYRNISGNKVNYSYNISLYYQDGSPVLVKINGTNITQGDQIPVAAQDIAKIERLVLSPINMAKFDAGLLYECVGQGASKTCINITGVQEENVLFEITNFTITNPNPPPSLMNIIINGNPIREGTDINDPVTDYVLWKKTNTSNFMIIGSIPIGVDRTDTLRFELKKSLFPNTLVLDFQKVDFLPPGPPPADYIQNLKTYYEMTKLVVEVWQ